jgi:pimeloyl-ACP methyl ester carboxylesterase
MTKRSKWGVAGIAVAAIAVGIWIAWLAIRPPIVDVHGRRVEVRIRGAGAPTVVFELGASGGNLTYWRVQNAVARKARTVVYERAGLGRSSLGEEPRSAEVIARELHELLEVTGQPPPYVLVGHSYGGLLVRVFAHMYPDEISGLVLVDPATEGMYAYLEKSTPQEWAAAASALNEGFQRQWRATPIAISQAESAWPLPVVPTTILTAQQPLGEWPLKGQADIKVWELEHQLLAGRIPGVRRVLMADSDHMSILLKDQLAEEILKVVDESRSGR